MEDFVGQLGGNVRDEGDSQPDNYPSPCTSQETVGSLTQTIEDHQISVEGNQQQSLERSGRSFYRDVATRYVESLIVLDDLRAQLETEVLEYLMQEYHHLPSPLLIGNLFLNEDFVQELFSSIFGSLIDSLSLLLGDFFEMQFSLTSKQIEKLSTQKLITQHFGSLLTSYRSSAKREEDAIAFVDEYYSASPCDRCKQQSCAACLRLYAFAVARRLSARDRSKEIYRVVAVDLYLKTYFLFLSQTLQGLDSFSSLSWRLSSTRSGDGGLSQLDFIELFLLGKFTLHGSNSPQLRPSVELHRGSLRAHLEEAQIFDASFFPVPPPVESHAGETTEEVPQSLPRTQDSLLRSDEAHFTRSRAPFLQPPLPHQRDPVAIETQLSGEEKELISRVRSRIDVCQNLEKLVENYCRTMSDLPGGVHSSTTQTVVAMAERLQMRHTESCWIDIGCGAPLMALQGSLFNKLTLALDLPPVMRTVLQILQLMPPEQRALANSIFLQEGDILHLDRESIPAEIANSVTHITNFIGTDEANDATVRFALSNFRSTLKYLCVRGKYCDRLERILEGYGFFLDPDCSFTMTLKASTTHRRKRVSTYVKSSPETDPLPDLAHIPIPKPRVSLIAGLYCTKELPEATDDPRDRANYFRALVADHHSSKVLYLSFSSPQLPRPGTIYHPHSLFLPRDLSSEHSQLSSFCSFDIESIETDPHCRDCFVELFVQLAPHIVSGGRMVSLKSEASVAKTLAFAEELSHRFHVSVSAMASASPYFSGLLHSESALKEMLSDHTSLSELVKRNGDGSGDAIVLQRSDDLQANEQSWKLFRKKCGGSSRDGRGKRRALLVATPDSDSPNLESPATSIDSERSDSPAPVRRGQGSRSKRRRGLPQEPEIIDLTGDSLEHARNFKRALHKKGRVTVTLVGEDNIPVTCVIPSSDSEADEEEAEAPAAPPALPPILYNSEDEI